jgi:hypothetical protein
MSATMLPGAPAGAAGARLCDAIARTNANAWVMLDNGKRGARRDYVAPSMVNWLPGLGKFLLTGYDEKQNEMLLDPAEGKWVEANPGPPPGRMFENWSGSLVWDTVANVGYGHLGRGFPNGSFKHTLMSFDFASKKWAELTPASDLPWVGDEAGIGWNSLCWLPESREIMLANGSCRFGGSGTWIYSVSSNTWRQLTFGSATINNQRAGLHQLHVQAQDLVAAYRNRHYRSETAEAAKQDLAKSGANLAVAIRSGAAAVGAAKGNDSYEQQQLARAKTALEAVAKVMDENAGRLAGILDVALLATLEDGVAEPLRAARDELAVEPPPRCNSPLLWHPVAKKVVMFGGDGHNRAYADTWLFDPATSRWTQMHPPVGPEPRAGHALVWLPEAKAVLLVGHGYAPNQARGRKGLYETLPFEMWTYDLSADRWALLTHVEKDTDAPPAMMSTSGSSSFAAGAGDVVLGMGRVGYYSPGEIGVSTWGCRVDASAADAAGTAKYGVKPGALAFFGGQGAYDHEPAEDLAAIEARLRNLPANTWTNVTVKDSCNSGYCGNWGTCILDPDADQFLWWRGGHAGYCGNDVAQYAIKANVWNVSYRPSHPLGYEGSCGGLAGHDFDGRPWQNMHSYRRYGYDPVARRLVFNLRECYAYDPVRRNWDAQKYANPGGVANLVATPHGLMGSGIHDRQMYRFEPGKGWVKQPLQGEWPKVCYFATSFIYDSKRDRVLAVGVGIGSSTLKNGEVWAYDCKTGEASELKAAHADKVKMDGESPRESVYIPDADLVLFDAGGADWNYVYDAGKNEWKSVRLKPKNVGGAGFGNGLLYDPKRKLIFEVAMVGYDFTIWGLRFDAATAEFAELK